MATKIYWGRGYPIIIALNRMDCSRLLGKEQISEKEVKVRQNRYLDKNCLIL